MCGGTFRHRALDGLQVCVSAGVLRSMWLCQMPRCTAGMQTVTCQQAVIIAGRSPQPELVSVEHGEPDVAPRRRLSMHMLAASCRISEGWDHR